MNTGKRATLAALFACGALPLLSGEELSLEWILSPENSRALQVPRCLWLPDDTLLFEDVRKPEAERALERFDPQLLERKPAVDPVKVIESWKSLLGEGKPPKWIGLPAAASADGKVLLYEREGDLFFLDLEKGSVRRVTNTDAVESAPRFSPDGGWLAYVRDNDLHAVEVASGRERRLTRDGSSTRLNGTLSWVYWEEIMDRRDQAYWWAPDSSAVLYLQTDESPVASFPIPDHEPPVPQVRWQRYPKAGGANPVARAGVVDFSGESTRWIDLGNPAPEYIARGMWLPDGKNVAIETLNRAQNRLDLWIVDRSSGERRRVHEETSSTWVDLHDDLYFLPAGERFLWLSERGGYRHLFLQGVNGGGAVDLTPGDCVVRSGRGIGTSGRSVAWIDSGAGQVLLHLAKPGPIETQLYRIEWNGRDMTRLSEGEGSHQITASPGGKFYLDEHSRSGVPPRLTLHRIDGSLLHVLAPSASEKLLPFALDPPQLFTVPADDGVPLQARLFRPSPLEEGRKYAAICYVYGGPGAPAIADRWDGTWYLWAQLLAKRGFAVFSVDNRSASDGGKAREETVFHHFYAEGELKDILAGVKHLKGLPFIDPERIGIWGWSGGGSNTLYAMTHCEQFRAGIAVAGVTDWRYYDTVYTERYMGRPSENQPGYRESSAANAAEKLHGRLLIVHGAADDNVHFQNSLRCVDSLIAAGKQFDLMIYPRRDHGIGDPAARRHLFQLMLDFWERNLKGR
jgi:dipeptidyl-peptidase-4